MTMVSVSEAARLVGKSRSVLYSTYINKGKLSVTKDTHTGKPAIDTAELLRVFGELAGQSKTDSTTDIKAQNRTLENDSKNSVLEAEVKALRELLAVREEQLQDAKDREAKLWHQVEDLTTAVRLIEDKSARESLRSRPGWWSRLLSRA